MSEERDPESEELKSVTVAMCQMKINEGGTEAAKVENLATVLRLIKRASNQGAHICCFPEMCSVGYDLAKLSGGQLPALAESVNEVTLELSPFLRTAVDCASSRGIALILPVPEVESVKKYSWEPGQNSNPKTRVYSTAFVFDATGRLLGKHRKVHLGNQGNVQGDDKVLSFGSDANSFLLNLSPGKSLRFGILLGSDLEYSHVDTKATAPRYQDKRYRDETDLVKTMAQFGAQCVFCASLAKAPSSSPTCATRASNKPEWQKQCQLAAGSGKLGGILICGVNGVGAGYSGGSGVWNGRSGHKGSDNRAAIVGKQMSTDREGVQTAKLPLHL